MLKERGMTCELCLKPNLLTKAVSSLDEYRRILNTFDEFGIAYTFSTGAPSLQCTSLAEEMILLLDHDAATEEQVLRALKAADDCCSI